MTQPPQGPPPPYGPPAGGPYPYAPAPTGQPQPQPGAAGPPGPYGPWWPAQQLPAPPQRPPYPHPEPRLYHQMFRTWNYAWWRPAVGILLLAAGMLLVLPLLFLPVLVIGVLIEGGQGDFLDALFRAGTFQELTPSGLLYLNLTLGGLILWTWGLIRVLHQMRPRWLTSVVPKMRWGFFALCLGLSVVALVAQFGVSLLLPESTNPDVASEPNELTGTLLVLAVVVLLTTPFQAAGEEYAFRGYLLQAVGSLTMNRWLAILVTATLFAMAHGLQNFPLFFDRFMFGVISGWLVVLTGGLEAAIAMHVLNNYLAFGFALAFGDITSALTIAEVSWWNIPVTLTQSLVYTALVVWAARRRGLRTRTAVPTG